MKRPLVPDGFDVPKMLETDRFRLRALTIADVIKDYEAVMTSVDHLRSIYGDWPAADLSLEQDLVDLGWHQKEFQMRTSFAYTVMSLDESRCLGCVYIMPTEKDGCDAEVSTWVRSSEHKSGLGAVLFQVVKQWIEDKWPFRRVHYLGCG